MTGLVMFGSFKTQSCVLHCGHRVQPIDVDDIREAMIPIAHPREDSLLNRPMKDGINLPKLMEELAQALLMCRV